MQKLRKRFGQHVLTDKNTIADIVQTIHPVPRQIICEIGPGLGAITLPILKKVGALHAIEIDRDLCSALLEKCKNVGKLTLHQNDALHFDFNDLASAGRPMRLIGNLPYNISTPLLFHLLRFSNVIADMHFTLQKEVVDRIVSTPGQARYSRLSVMVQSYYGVERLFDITSSMFTPPPKVMSSFMRLLPHAIGTMEIINRALFDNIIASAFQQRRKTVRNSLASMVSTNQLRQARIDPNQRPQEISIRQYITLANQLSN